MEPLGPAASDPAWGELPVDPAVPEAVTVVAEPTQPVVDTVVEELAGDAAVALAPPVLFGGVAGVELGRGLDAEEAAWARQIVDRLGGVELLDRGPDLDAEHRARIVTARALARGRPWVVLEDPLRHVPRERRRKAARVLEESRRDAGLIVVVPDVETAGLFPYRIVHAPTSTANG